MKAVKVPKVEAEKVRRFAEKVGAKDKNRLIVTRGDYVEIPIYDGYEHLFKDYEIIEQENPVFAKKTNLFEILKEKIPKELWDYIPRRYKILGDIILIKIADELEEYKRVIGETLLNLHPRCKAVWRDKGKEGMLRKPNVELIAGSGSVTIHKENGCYFKLDVTKVMFSVGNQGERMRIVKLVKDGEVIVDMFAGIGYFSIPIAVHSKPKVIYSIEINPESYSFLLENIKLNRVDTIVPILGFLPVAINALKDEGGIIHYHESTPEAVLNRPIERIKSVCEKLRKNVKILNFRKVKNYSPGVYHMVVDAYIF